VFLPQRVKPSHPRLRGVLAFSLLAVLCVLTVPLGAAAARQSSDTASSSAVGNTVPPKKKPKVKPKKKAGRIVYLVEATYQYKHVWNYDNMGEATECVASSRYYGRGSWAETYEVSTRRSVGDWKVGDWKESHTISAPLTQSRAGNMTFEFQVREGAGPECGTSGVGHQPSAGCGTAKGEGVIHTDIRRRHGRWEITLFGWPERLPSQFGLDCYTPVGRDEEADVEHRKWAPWPWEKLRQGGHAWSTSRVSVYDRIVGPPGTWPFPTVVKQTWSLSWLPVRQGDLP
jgi:hypothetical protein